jgi:hypothetical protein
MHTFLYVTQIHIAKSQKIGKPNNLIVFGSKFIIKEPKQNCQYGFGSHTKMYA